MKFYITDTDTLDSEESINTTYENVVKEAKNKALRNGKSYLVLFWTGGIKPTYYGIANKSTFLLF